RSSDAASSKPSNPPNPPQKTHEPKATSETTTTDSKPASASSEDETPSNRKKTKTSEPKSTVTSKTVPITASEKSADDAQRHTAKKTTVSDPAPKPVAPAETLAMVSTLGTANRQPGQAARAASSTTTATSTVKAQAVAVSPLGPPEHLAAERRAAETVNTLPVKLMKLVLEFGWRSTAQKQFKLVGGPDQANLDALDEAVDEYAMGAAFQQQLLNPMTPTAVMQVAPPHTWYGQDVGGSRILYDNPDTI